MTFHLFTRAALLGDTFGSALAAAAALLAEPAPPVTLDTVIGRITQWVLGLLLAIATLFLTAGAVRYVAAGGDPMQIEKAKTALRSALIGYGLALLAPVLLRIVSGWVSP
ncbi:pilin [Catelliglobosispora koreensis]|uniref:pilin n=1 Tax=Catelliglobosispora koreensis TaxID=129052 RepID=UPI00036926B5|nr:pilin [Catelliglobosispora koreensis]